MFNVVEKVYHVSGTIYVTFMLDKILLDFFSKEPKIYLTHNGLIFFKSTGEED